MIEPSISLILAASSDLIRPTVSLDYDDILAFGLALAVAVVGAVVWRKSRTESSSTESSEVVDGGVLAQFMELTNKVLALQNEVTLLRVQYTEAIAQMQEMTKVEEFLRASMHDKDKIIEDLRKRVKHLEDVCRRAGINGDTV